MENNENKDQTLDQTLDQDYLAIIEQQRLELENTVSKEEYAKLQAEHKKLLNDYINKRPIKNDEPEVLKTAKELATELKSVGIGDITNRGYIAKALDYRNAVLRETGKDVFSHDGLKSADTEEVATALQALVDSESDPSVFNAKLQNMLVDDNALLAKLKRR